jgi:hypothetical protein
MQAHREEWFCGHSVARLSAQLQVAHHSHLGALPRSNVDCEWFIHGPPGHFLSFHFPQFDLPSYSNCSLGDYVQVPEIVVLNN